MAAFLKIGTLELGVAFNYTITPKSFDEHIRMASKKLVTEKRGSKWIIKVNYKYLTDTDRAALYAALNAIPDGGVAVEFYNPSGVLDSGYFTVTDIPAPKIESFNGLVPDIWSNVGFTLEEV